MKAIPWEMFLLWVKKTTKVCKTVGLSTPVYVPNGVQNTIVADTCHVNTQSVDISVCVCVVLQNLSNVLIMSTYITPCMSHSETPGTKNPNLADIWEP